MSSRAEQKAAARAARIEAEASERRRSARRRALVWVAGLAALATLVVVVAVVMGQQHESAPSSPAAGRVFAGVEQDGIALGSNDAPATLVEFADLQCPFCAVYARDILPTVVDRYVRSGRLRLELRVLSFLGEDSVRAGVMAAAAASQDRLWSFADGFYRNQGQENSGYATDDFLQRVAEETRGLDVARALAERHAAGARRMLDESDALAGELGAEFTPSFFLRQGDEPARPVEPSKLTTEAFTTALDAALAAR